MMSLLAFFSEISFPFPLSSRKQKTTLSQRNSALGHYPAQWVPKCTSTNTVQCIFIFFGMVRRFAP